MNSTLAHDVFSTTIHGTTGQLLDEGTLAAGTLVRHVRAEEREDGTETRFQASTDGGQTWFEQVTFDRVTVEPADAWELHLVASEPSNGDRHCDPDSTARRLGVYPTRDEAFIAGRAYRSDHPAAWLQVCQPGGEGEDVD